MNEDEKYVREQWEPVWVTYRDTAIGVLAGPHYVIIGGYPERQLFAAYRHTSEGSWSAAAAFTRERLEEIRQLREEIAQVAAADRTAMDYQRLSVSDSDAERWELRHAAWGRILSRLESVLKEKLRGMKEGAQ